MKKDCLLLLAWVLLMLPAFSQNVAINTDASLPNANAILDLKSGNKGLLIPRMNTAARNAIPNTKGLLVYDTTTNGFWYNTGSEWKSIATAALSTSLAVGSAWLLTGNSGTSDTANFLGTTDNVPLNIRVNNQPSGQINPTTKNTYWGYNAAAVPGGGNINSNTVIGYREFINSRGVNNTAIGSESMEDGNSGIDNTAVGQMSLWRAGGAFNCAMGVSALHDNTTGAWNVAIGNSSLVANNTGNFNTAVGYDVLLHSTSQSNQTAIGNQSLFSNTNGEENTAIGSYSLNSNTTGSWNTATGYQSLFSNTTAFHGTAIGYQSLYSNTTGDGNTATGYQSLYSNTTGYANTADGHFTMTANSTGYGNAAVGTKSLYVNTTGFYNAALGLSALSQNTTGANNTAIGTEAMNVNTIGNGNTAIGSFSNVSTTNLTNATVIGYGATVNASNKVRIGNSAVTVIEGQVPFTTPSDGRFKFHVQEDVKGLDFILQLRPVTYQFDTKRFDAQMNHQANIQGSAENFALQASYDEATRIRRSGFIAQEVEQAAKTSGYDFSGIVRPKTEEDHYSLSYEAFVVPLVKAVQEQEQIIREQDKKIAGLQQQLDEIKKLLQHSK